jgi:phospholipid/cholesterol/gamma-HCH transport system permease protein
VTGGAESVGQRTTRAVVLSIAAIIVTDMIFAFLVSR